MIWTAMGVLLCMFAFSTAVVVEWTMVKEDTQGICCRYGIWLKNKWLGRPLPKYAVYNLRHTHSNYEVVWSLLAFIKEPKLTFIIYCLIMIFSPWIIYTYCNALVLVVASLSKLKVDELLYSFPRMGRAETVSGVVYRKIIVWMGYMLFLATPVTFDSPVSPFCV